MLRIAVALASLAMLVCASNAGAQPAGADESIYISDFSACQPASSLTRKQAPGKWFLINYEAEKCKGTMLTCGFQTKPPVVTLPLKQSGWYGLYVGIWGWEDPVQVRLRLSGEPNFTEFRREQTGNYGTNIEEHFWRYADLTGQDLVIGPPTRKGDWFPKTFLAYLRLEPLSAEQAQAAKADRPRRRLIATNDAHTQYIGPYEDDQNIIDDLGNYRESDFFRIDWDMGGYAEGCTYPTKWGFVFGEQSKDFEAPYDWAIATTMQNYKKRGIDSMASALKWAHRNHLEFYVYERMGAFCLPPPQEETYTGPFYKKHPELHAAERDGSPVPRLSYAFPEVQDHVVAGFREVAGYGPDGITMCFIRGAPFLLWEKPLIDGFQAKYGEDPRKLADVNDPRWLQFKADVMTGFVRKVRIMLRDESERQNLRHPIKLSAMVYDIGGSMNWGLDVATWMKEGLVDSILPTGGAQQYVDLKTQAPVYPMLNCAVNDMRTRMRDTLATGAAGGFWWDVNGTSPTKTPWNVLRRLGHREDLDKALTDADKPTYQDVLQIEDYPLKPWNPLMGG